MIPGVNPRQMQQMMKQMGMSQESLSASEVIIKVGDKMLVFDSPDVQKVTMQGQTTFQIAGSYREEMEQVSVEISDDDVNMVKEQAGVSEDEARKALETADGDIAQAIVNLSN